MTPVSVHRVINKNRSVSPYRNIAGSIDGETLHAAKRPRIQQSVSSNTSASTSQNDGDVITYQKP